MARYIALSLSEVTSGTWGRSLGFSQPDSINDGLQLLEHEAGIFGAIQTGDLNQVLKFIAEDKGVLKKTDAAGAAPVHAAFLYGKEDIGKMLVQMHPECTLQKYVAGPYTGENILHIAIVHRQTPLAVWLLKQNPQLLNAEATGHFFEPSGDAYFGGFPFLFAVSSNQQDIAEHILQCDCPESPEGLQNSILLQDSHGNNALHMAVIHDLPNMYDFAMAHTTATLGPETALEFGRTLNVQHLTPLALAAAMGRVDMFRHILASNSKDAWEYGPIKCKMVPIWSLEQPRVHVDRKKRQMKRSKEVLALHCICADAHQPITNCLKLRNGKVSKEVEEARLQLVQVPEVQQLLDAKWEMFGKGRFFKKLFLVMGVQVLWVAGMVLLDHWRLDYDNVFNYPVSNGFIITIEGIVLISALQRLFDEARGLMQKGKRYISQTHGAAALEQTLGTLFSIFYITSWILRLCNCLDEEDILASAAGLVGWCYSFFFLLGFRSTGPFIIMIMEIIQYDIRRIIVVWFAVLVAYTTALYLVMDWQNQPGVTQYFQQMLNLVYVTVNANLFPQSNYIASAWMPILLTLTYMVLVLILLINLLIAMMSNTFNRVDDNAEWRWYIEKANIMAAFEASLTAREMERCRRKYAVPLGGTADDEFTDLYLQVKIVNPKWKLQSSKANDTPRSATSSNAVLQRTRPVPMAMPDVRPIRDPAYLGSPNAPTPTSAATAAISDQ